MILAIWDVYFDGHWWSSVICHFNFISPTNLVRPGEVRSDTGAQINVEHLGAEGRNSFLESCPHFGKNASSIGCYWDGVVSNSLMSSRIFQG